MNQKQKSTSSYTKTAKGYTTGNTGTTIQGEEISDILTESSIPINNTKQALPFIVMMKNMMDFYMKNPELQKSMDSHFQSVMQSQIADYSKPNNLQNGDKLGFDFNENLAVKKNLNKIENCRSVPNFENKADDPGIKFNSTSGTLEVNRINEKNVIRAGSEFGLTQKSDDSKENKNLKSPSASSRKKNELNVVHNYNSQAPKLMFKKKKETTPDLKKSDNFKIFSSLNKYNIKTSMDFNKDAEEDQAIFSDRREVQSEAKSRRAQLDLENFDLDFTQSLSMKPEPLPKSPNRINHGNMRVSRESEN